MTETENTTDITNETSESTKLLVEKFTFEEIDSEIIDERRFYKTPNGNLPSVTTILSATKDEKSKTALNNWKANQVRMYGEDGAEQRSQATLDLGTLMHEELEHYIAGEPRANGTNFIYKQAGTMADQVIKHGLKNVDEVWGVEVPVYYKEYYAGRTDCVGVHNGRPAIIDFKTTAKRKQRSFISEYMMQLTAYARAVNWLLETRGEPLDVPIRKGCIMMVGKDGEYQEFILDGEEFDEYSVMWENRVLEYQGLQAGK